MMFYFFFLFNIILLFYLGSLIISSQYLIILYTKILHRKQILIYPIISMGNHSITENLKKTLWEVTKEIYGSSLEGANG
jgi:hypothetical protein